MISRDVTATRAPNRAVLWTALLFLLAAALGAPLEARPRIDRLWLTTGSGEHQIEIEIAETPEDQAFGLMFRTALADGRGMLFPYPAPRDVSMWMKNTYISLDMIFIRADGAVHRIERRTEPLSEKIIHSQGAVLAVLEIAAGGADRLGLKPGDQVRHPMFAPGAR